MRRPTTTPRAHTTRWRTAALVMALALAMTAASLAHTRASDALRLPFEPPAGDWYVQQGYDQGTHTSYERYALDLARRDDGAGSLIVAPASGAIAWTDDAFGCVSIALGRDNLYLSSCHIEPLKSLAAGQGIAAGAPIGFVAVAGTRGNGGMAHVHIALYADPSGGRDRSQRVAQPFDGEFALGEFAFPAGQEHTGFDFGAPRPPAAPATPRPGPPPAPDLPVQNIREGTNVIAYFGAALPPADAFAALGNGYVAAYEWDAASQTWLLDLAAAPEAGTIELIQPYRAYVVTSSSAVTLEPPADAAPPPPPPPLREGGNLVVYSGASRDATGLAATLDGALTAAFVFDDASGTWGVFVPGAEGASTFSTFEQHRVYWLVLARDATLAP